MANFDPLAYMPLMQSLAGALGGFLVAAFTVFITNRHTRSREDRQSAVARKTERHRLYREKLEQLLSLTQQEGHLLAEGIDKVITLDRDGESVEAYQELRRHRIGVARSFQAALTLQQLYFPSLASELAELLVAVKDGWESLNSETDRLRLAGRRGELPNDATRQAFHDRNGPKFARVWDAQLALVAAARSIVLEGVSD